MIEIDRCFRMSVFNAIDGLLTGAKLYPGTELGRVATTLCAGSSSEAGFDYQLAISILEVVPELMSVASESREDRLRSFLTHLLLNLQPPWRRLVPKGRAFLHSYLDEDARAVFENAGLYGEADAPIRVWWDRLGALVRGLTDEHLLEIGRRGEELTLRLEQERLAELGRADLRPEWVGFEDNSLGYDIRSFAITGSTVLPRYIEVKATTADDLRFYLTRNEWRTAERFNRDYVLHLWNLPAGELHEITPNELSVHLPQDQGRGLWDIAMIRWL